MKYIKWFLKSLIIAFLIILIINILGSFVNINIPVNIWTILIILFLRIPGAIVLIILFLI